MKKHLFKPRGLLALFSVLILSLSFLESFTNGQQKDCLTELEDAKAVNKAYQQLADSFNETIVTSKNETKHQFGDSDLVFDALNQLIYHQRQLALLGCIYDTPALFKPEDFSVFANTFNSLWSKVNTSTIFMNQQLKQFDQQCNFTGSGYLAAQNLILQASQFMNEYLNETDPAKRNQSLTSLATVCKNNLCEQAIEKILALLHHDPHTGDACFLGNLYQTSPFYPVPASSITKAPIQVRGYRDQYMQRVAYIEALGLLALTTTTVYNIEQAQPRDVTIWLTMQSEYGPFLNDTMNSAQYFYHQGVDNVLDNMQDNAKAIIANAVKVCNLTSKQLVENLHAIAPHQLWQVKWINDAKNNTSIRYVFDTNWTRAWPTDQEGPRYFLSMMPKNASSTKPDGRTIGDVDKCGTSSDNLTSLASNLFANHCIAAAIAVRANKTKLSMDYYSEFDQNNYEMTNQANDQECHVWTFKEKFTSKACGDSEKHVVIWERPSLKDEAGVDTIGEDDESSLTFGWTIKNQLIQ